MDKERLKCYRWIVAEINELVDELASLRGVKATAYTSMPRGGVKADTANICAKIEVLTTALDIKVDGLIKLRQEIEEAIDKLEPNERRLIRLKYVEGLSWEEVAVKMHYSYNYVVKELHSKALMKIKNFQKGEKPQTTPSEKML